MFRTGKRHKITSEAGKRNERGVDPTVTEAAADRVVELLGRPTAAAPAEPGVTVVGTPPAARRRSSSPPTCRPGSPAWRSAPRPTVAHLRGRRLRGRRADGDGLLTVDPAAVAPRPHRPLRPGRGGRPDRRLRPGAVGAAARGRRSRADPRAAAAPPGRPHPRRRRLRRGDQLPVRRRRRLDQLGLPADDARRHTVRLANPLSTEEPSYTTTLLPGPAQGRRAQPRSRCPRRGALRDRHRRVPGRPRSARRSTASTGAPTTPSSTSSFEAIPRPAAAPRRRAGRRARARRLVGRGPRRGLVRRDRPSCAGWPTSSASTSRSARPSRRPWHPGRCAELAGRRASSSGHAGELHPQVCRASACPAAQRRGRDRPRRPDGRAPSTSSPGPASRPTRWPRRTSPSSSTTSVTGRRGRGGAARGRRRPARVDPALRRLHRRPGRRGPQVAGLRAALPGPRPHPDRARRPAPPATPRWRRPPSVTRGQCSDDARGLTGAAAARRGLLRRARRHRRAQPGAARRAGRGRRAARSARPTWSRRSGARRRAGQPGQGAAGRRLPRPGADRGRGRGPRRRTATGSALPARRRRRAACLARAACATPGAPRRAGDLVGARDRRPDGAGRRRRRDRRRRAGARRPARRRPGAARPRAAASSVGRASALGDHDEALAPARGAGRPRRGDAGRAAAQRGGGARRPGRPRPLRAAPRATSATGSASTRARRSRRVHAELLAADNPVRDGLRFDATPLVGPRRRHPRAARAGPRVPGDLDPRPGRPRQDPAGPPARPRGASSRSCTSSSWSASPRPTTWSARSARRSASATR